MARKQICLLHRFTYLPAVLTKELSRIQSSCLALLDNELAENYHTADLPSKHRVLLNK